MNINNAIVKAFANNLAEIDTAIVTKCSFAYVDFVNDIDQLLWTALNEGNVVPELYIEMINQALTDLSSEYKDKYLNDYAAAVDIFEKNSACDIAADFVCSPEYIGRKTEEAFYYENSNEDEYEMNMALGQYSKVTRPEREHEGAFDYYLGSDVPPCRLYKRLNYNAFYVCNEGVGNLVKWFVEIDGDYYSFVDHYKLTDIDLITKMETFFHAIWVIDPIDIVKESDWIIDENHTEYKMLIGCSRAGHYFGYVSGYPDSEPYWIGDAFTSIEKAEEGRIAYEFKIEQDISNQLEKQATTSTSDSDSLALTF